MTKKQPGFKKELAIWAIDPFEESLETRKCVLSALRDVSRQGMRIKPVYVFSPAEYGLTGVEVAAPWVRQNEPIMKRMADQYIAELRKESRIEGLEAPSVITERRPSTRYAVRALGGFARLQGARMIIVGTHGRQGLARLFMGSFAESLLLDSRLPVLVVNPHSEHSESRKILFPTDLGRLSSKLFSQVLKLARSRGASITLLHVLPRPAAPIIQNGVYLLSGAYLAWPEFVTASEQRQRRSAERLVQAGNKAGVRVSVIFDTEHASVSQSVLEHAKREQAHLIAMGAQSGAIASSLMGSVTRQVVRQAACPVWVLRVGGQNR